MAQKNKTKGERNGDRKNGKSFKKHPGVAPKAHNGKTNDGYTPERAELRAVIRRATALKSA
jgi:hypothetical protein